MRLLRRVHLALGLTVSLPLLCWTLSGLLYLLPTQVTGGARYAAIEPARIRITPAQALARASAFAGRALPITALTLEQKDGRLAYQAIGGLGMDSVTIDAETGLTALTAPPGPATRFFRNAHFFSFAGQAQAPLLGAFAALAACSAFSGLVLAADALRRRR